MSKPMYLTHEETVALVTATQGRPERVVPLRWFTNGVALDTTADCRWALEIVAEMRGLCARCGASGHSRAECTPERSAS